MICDPMCPGDTEDDKLSRRAEMGEWEDLIMMSTQDGNAPTQPSFVYVYV